ncbi:Endonuclease/exonuclease/phosphatase [Lipomyces arxii]|uniref:Endonuclease/exonuclease/phosphatase n=1 Tax=Lipomyces arxii TaxID=56418 RepID=UPI0034CEF76B
MNSVHYSFSGSACFTVLPLLLSKMLIKIQWEDSKEELPLKVYTHNIRYSAKHLSDGEKSWETRKHLVASSIEFNTFNQTAIVCLQEVLHNQLLDLLELLGKDWTYCGVGRNDGGSKGEYAPILYRKHQFTVEMNRTFWLSETPDFPSRGWDAASIRIVNAALFSHNTSGRVLYMLNTHLDDQGVKARVKGAELIKDIIMSLQNHDALILCGDMNSEHDEEAYSVFAEFLKDSSKQVISKSRYGNSSTFTGFKNNDKKEIDYIFVHDGVQVSSYGVLGNRFDDDVFSSDHRPVVANLVILNRQKGLRCN